MSGQAECECGKKKNTFSCAGCEKTMCFGCQTGDQCSECERYFCNGEDDACQDYTEHRSGNHLVCWDCIMEGLVALRKQKDADPAVRHGHQ
jgi:hypothetical protein